jgi:hypothetical protein
MKTKDTTATTATKQQDPAPMKTEATNEVIEVTIDERLAEAAKKIAASRNESFSQFAEKALMAYYNGDKTSDKNMNTAPKTKSKSRTDRPRLEPITITIRDQDELRRIHRLAKFEGRKPEFSAQCALRGGVWDGIHAWKAVTTGIPSR